MKRRTVHKISPSKAGSFDQQFWPVMVALTVLCGIALGAVLTVLRGPWMWGSLLLLPLLSILSLVLLFNIDDNRLRRSLQFAIITSFAAHLMILVLASVVNIFQNPFKPQERAIAQRQVRTIEISDQRASFVWEETNARETPEPEVEKTERKKQTTTDVPPQTVPVVETETKPNPQLVRRENTAQTVPRQSRSLSQLRRQTQTSPQPTASRPATAQPVPKQTTSTPSESKAQSSPRADSVAKASTNQPQPAAQPASAAPQSQSQPTKQAASSPRRSRSDVTSPSRARPSPSSARVTRSTPRIPVQSKPATPSPTLTKSATPQPVRNQPSKSSSELTRRPRESRVSRPTFTPQPNASLSPKPQLAKTVQRRTATPTQPSISNPNSSKTKPRRSVTESQLASSPVAVENPARSPESSQLTRQLKSKTLSVSRSTSGVAGAGKSNNLERFTGGLNSPASRPSDSARRERTQSASADARMLTSSRKSTARRSTGALDVPTSAFKSETDAAAKIAGAKTTSERTAESSAATVSAASTNHRDQVSAEKGNTSVDLGATKVVAERQTNRRSGGGQPEVAQLNPDSTRRSKDRSNQQPSLVANLNAEVSAPRSQSVAPPSTNALEASSKSSVAARAGGESETTVQRWGSQSAGPITDAGQTNVTHQLSDSRQRARHSADESSISEDDEDDENQRGNERTRIAKAPITNSDSGLGMAESGEPSMNAEGTASAPSESATQVARQSSSVLPGSGLGRAAANALMQAATSLPVIEAGTGSGRRITRNSTPDATGSESNRNGNSPKRSSRSAVADVAPSPTGTGELESPVKGSAVGQPSDASRLDSSPVSLARSDIRTDDQNPGSQLDVDAIDGPAGLGTRPADLAGVMSRPASRESEQLLPDTKQRFRNEKFGGAPALNPDAVIAQEAFQNRSPAAMVQASEPSTEAAIHLGLEFLARYQLPDGSWSLTGFDREAPQHLNQLDSDTAATGLAVLAFQGAGYNHREFKYARQVNQAIQWMVENQATDGGLYVSSDKKSDSACRLYSHGIAALALTEAYGMTQDAELKEPAQKAIDYIIATQHSRKGGWRYFDVPNKRSSDTSVSGWMMMALQSGRLAGLDVEQEVFRSVDDWLEIAADPNNESLYRYNPYAVDSKGVSRIQGRKPTVSMTSVGLLMRIYSGWKKDDPRLLAGAQYLLDNQLPDDSTPQLRDTYYWYYATQVLKHVDGPQWRRWNDKLRPLLTRTQEQEGEFAGSWHPYRPVPDRWGAFGGRLYVTTMNLLSLEVRHRMLPLYKQNAPDKEVTKISFQSDRSASMTQPISTNVKSVQTTPQQKPIARLQDVAQPKQPQSKPSQVGGMVAQSTNLRKQITQNRTVVRKPALDSRTIAPLTPALHRPSDSNDIRPSLMPRHDPNGNIDDLIHSGTHLNIRRTKLNAQPPTDLVDIPPPLQYASVSGRVTLNGKTLDKARVEFISIGKQKMQASTRTNSLGQFKFGYVGNAKQPGLLTGRYKISITTFVESDDEKVIDFLEKIPPKYNTQTQLTTEVTADQSGLLSLELSTR